MHRTLALAAMLLAAAPLLPAQDDLSWEAHAHPSTTSAASSAAAGKLPWPAWTTAAF